MEKPTTNIVSYCTVRWCNHNANLNHFLPIGYAGEKYTDVALASEGNILKAHRIILAGCSPLFDGLFSAYGNGNPNLLIPLDGWGISYSTLQMVLEFMYSGEIRVKKSELETLVNAGVKLKVKGLDSVKLPESKPSGVRQTNSLPTVVKPTKIVKSPLPLPRPTITQTYNSGQKVTRKLFDALKKPKSLSVAKDKIDMAKLLKTESPLKTEEQNDYPADESKNDEDILLKTEVAESPKPQTPPSVVSSDALPTKTKRVRKPRVARPAAEKKVARTQKLATDSDSVSSLQSESDVPKVASPQKPKEGASLGDAADQPSEGTEGNSEAAMPPSENQQEEQESEEDPTSVEESPVDSSTTQSATEKNSEGEMSSRSARTIKKPARWADEDFIQEPPVSAVKKRRTPGSLAEGKESPTVAEGEPPQLKKKKPNPFLLFSQDFKAKLQEDFPDESRQDITKRLRSMWKHLDPAEKDKYMNDPETREPSAKKP